MSDQSVSVVVCAYTLDRWDDLRAAIASLAAQTRPALEVLVVIDHNPELLERAQRTFIQAQVLANQLARGLSGARNTGIAAASGDIVAFLDDDAVAQPNWLEHIVAAYADPKVACVGGAIEPLWEERQPQWLPDEFYWTVGCTYRGMPTDIAPVRNLIGANMSALRTICLAVDGFNSAIGQVGAGMLRCDDTEFCIRVRQRYPDATVLYTPKAQVAHRVTRGRTQWSYFRQRCYTEGQAKALVATLVGAQDGLSSERAYTLRTLPAGVLRGLAEALRGDWSGAQRAAAIVCGLGYTVAGYAQASVVARLARRRRALRTQERFS